MWNEQIDICIIGGGFTGSAAVISCLKQLERPFRLSLIEPSGALGRGVAYGGHHPLHLLNVRTRDLTVHAERPRDFLNWAFREIDQGENDVNLLEGLAHAFLPRQLFGEYVRQRLFEAVAVRGDVAFNIVNESAFSLSRPNGCFQVQTSGGGSLSADVVILATAYGQQVSSTTGALTPYESLPRERASKAKSIVLIGSGLTMIDALLAARRDGFSGRVTIISRHGLLPRRHADKGVVSQEVGLPQFKHLSRLTASPARQPKRTARPGRPSSMGLDRRSRISGKRFPSRNRRVFSAMCAGIGMLTAIVCPVRSMKDCRGSSMKGPPSS